MTRSSGSGVPAGDKPLRELRQGLMGRLMGLTTPTTVMPDQGGQSASQFSDIRVMINSGRLVEAEELLDGVPEYRRDAEWFFLKGSVAASKGWMDAALQYFSTACQKNPSNQEYRAALNRLMYQRQTAYNQSVQMTSMSCCDLCAGMYCASCCCDCLGHGC